MYIRLQHRMTIDRGAVMFLSYCHIDQCCIAKIQLFIIFSQSFLTIGELILRQVGQVIRYGLICYRSVPCLQLLSILVNQFKVFSGIVIEYEVIFHLMVKVVEWG